MSEPPQIEPSQVPVLLVDDQPANLLALEALLAPADYELVSVRSGEEAVRQVARRDFAVVLLDVMMPGLDGFETASLMRRAGSQQERPTPIIFVTAMDMPQLRMLEAYEGGAVDVIQKPSPPEIIRSKVAVFAELYRSREIVARERARREASAAAAKADALADELSVTGTRFEAARAIAGIGVFDWDLHQGRVYWSPEVYALAGLDVGPQPAAASWWLELLAEDDRDGALGALGDAVGARSDRAEMEVRLRHSSGGTRWVRVTTRITYDAAGSPIRFLGAIVDIEKLKKSATALERANRAKDAFLATVSHELRTPLNAILGWATILRDRNLTADVARAVEVIERNARRQARLIDDVLDMSRVTSGKLVLDVQPLCLGDVVRAAIDTVTPDAVAKGISIVSEIDPIPTTTGDGDRLQQVSVNLLANAVKFTPAGGTVSVHVERDGPMLALSVADTGEGIRPDALPYIFEPFQQADASTTRRHGGLGLGLAIVKQIVTAHGGSIWAESDGGGRGARFEVRLPAAPPATSPSGAAPAAAPLVPLQLDGVVVLAVDDEADAREVVRVVLERHGATVSTAASAEEAFARLATMTPDVIVSDIGMPDMDGYAFLRKVREREADGKHGRSRTPAVALTAFARKEDVARASAADFDVHVSKPLDPALLSSVVAQLVRRADPAR